MAASFFACLEMNVEIHVDDQGWTTIWYPSLYHYHNETIRWATDERGFRIFYKGCYWFTFRTHPGQFVTLLFLSDISEHLVSRCCCLLSNSLRVIKDSLLLASLLLFWSWTLGWCWLHCVAWVLIRELLS